MNDQSLEFGKLSMHLKGITDLYFPAVALIAAFLKQITNLKDTHYWLASVNNTVSDRFGWFALIITQAVLQH